MFSIAILVNEATVKQFGRKSPIGQRITTIGNGSEGSKRIYTIVGVTKDFHFESMHERIGSLVMCSGIFENIGKKMESSNRCSVDEPCEKFTKRLAFSN